MFPSFVLMTTLLQRSSPYCLKEPEVFRISPIRYSHIASSFVTRSTTLQRQRPCKVCTSYVLITICCLPISCPTLTFPLLARRAALAMSKLLGFFSLGEPSASQRANARASRSLTDCLRGCSWGWVSLVEECLLKKPIVIGVVLA